MTDSAITSSTNPRIKAVVRLRDRRERERSGQTLIDGARELRRALDAGAAVVEAYVCEPLLAGPDARAALDGLRIRRVPVTTVGEAAFARLAFGDRAEGLVAVVRSPVVGLDLDEVTHRALEPGGVRRRDRHQPIPRTCSTTEGPLRGRVTATRSTRTSRGSAA